MLPFKIGKFYFACLRQSRLFHIENVFITLNSRSRCSYYFPVRKLHQTPYQEELQCTSEFDQRRSRAIIEKVNQCMTDNVGRLFAVIHILGKQYRVVAQDIILIERNWPPNVNDKLIFEKVLLVGGSSFTLIGKPVLPKNIVEVFGTIVHKDLTHTKIRYFNIPKERVHNLNFVREELTYIRINDIKVYPKLNVLENVEYLRK